MTANSVNSSISSKVHGVLELNSERKMRVNANLHSNFGPGGHEFDMPGLKPCFYKAQCFVCDFRFVG